MSHSIPTRLLGRENAGYAFGDQIGSEQLTAERSERGVIPQKAEKRGSMIWELNT